MKQFLYFLTLSLLLFGGAFACEAPAEPAPAAYEQQEAAKAQTYIAQTPTGGDTIVITDTPTGGTIMSWGTWIWENLENFGAMLLLLIAFYEPIARLTPTEKDNNLLRTIQSWLDAILPNRKKGGGTFSAYRSRDDAPRAGFVEQRE